MKTTIVLAGAALALAGCATTTTPTKLSGDAYKGMWSSKPTDQVAGCLQQHQLPASFKATDISGKKTPFMTMVSVTSDEVTDAQTLSALECL